MEPFSPSTLNTSGTLHPEVICCTEKAKCNGGTLGKKVTQTFIALLDTRAQGTMLPSP